ncbi:MAG: hypothetical protein ACP5HK_04445 [Acidilobus sp.]
MSPGDQRPSGRQGPQGRPTNDRPSSGPAVEARQEPKPKPIGDRCSPLCPFFRCAQKALRFTTEYYRGRPVKVAMCALVGDRCVGTQCRFAYCEKRAMLPDGRCAFAVEAKARAMKSFEEELQEEAKFATSLGFKKKGLEEI